MISLKWWDPAEWHLAHVRSVLKVHRGDWDVAKLLSWPEKGFLLMEAQSFPLALFPLQSLPPNPSRSHRLKRVSDDKVRLGWTVFDCLALLVNSRLLLIGFNYFYLKDFTTACLSWACHVLLLSGWIKILRKAIIWPLSGDMWWQTAHICIWMDRGECSKNIQIIFVKLFYCQKDFFF